MSRETLLVFVLVLFTVFSYALKGAVIDGIGTENEIEAVSSNQKLLEKGSYRSGNRVTINFDDFQAPCVFASTTALRNRYQSLGVTFTGPGINDGGGILDECGNFGVSGYSRPNFLAYNPGARFSNGGIPRDPQTMHFDPPVSSVSFYVFGHYGGTVNAYAYDANNQLVDSDSANLVSNGAQISLSGTGIVRVVYSTNPNKIYVMDNLSFTQFQPSPTPTYTPTLTFTPTISPTPTNTPTPPPLPTFNKFGLFILLLLLTLLIFKARIKI